MASNRRLNRQQLSTFLKSPELIRAFEDIDLAATQTLPVDVATAQATANNALELATAQVLGVFEPRAQVISVRSGDGIRVTPDAAGYVITADLEFLINAVRSFLPRSQSINVRQGDGIQVASDAGGYVVAVDMAHLVNAIKAFLPRPSPPATMPDDAQMILAGRIFGR